MAVSFVGLTDSGYASRVGEVTSAVPGGVADGDLLILAVILGNPSGAGQLFPITPTGWTILSATGVQDGSGFDLTTNIYWRVASSEPASYLIDYIDNSLPSEAVMVAYRGTATGTLGYTVNTGTGSTTTMSGMTADVDGTRFLFIAHDWQASGGRTPPAGTTPTWTERLDASGSLMYVADGSLDNGQSTGNDTYTTANGASEPWTAVVVAIEPAITTVTGSLSASESGADTAALAGDVIVAGALAASETGADTAAIAGDVIVLGTVAANEAGADSAALAAVVLVTGLLEAVEIGGDTCLMVGPAIVEGSLAAQESGADRASIRQAVQGTSDALAYSVAANDLRYSVAARGMSYSVAASDLRYSVAAHDLRLSVTAR
jgi:hypothetical protein